MNSKDSQLGQTVVHVVQHLAPGGLESLALDLLSFSTPLNRVMIVSLEGEKNQSITNWPRLKPFANQVLFLEKQPGVKLGTLAQLIKVFRQIKPDVVHTHHIGPLVYAGLAARLASVPVRIHTEHDVWHLNNVKHRRLERVALNISKPQLVADADQVKNALLNHFSYENTITIKNGIDGDKFQPGSMGVARKHFHLPSDKTLIGCAGRLEHVKGHDLAIAALSYLPRNIELVIAGDGSQRQKLAQLARQYAVSDRVTFLGLVDDMQRFYQALDIFCMPSRSEGFPLSPLEAQACNVPTAVTDVGASKETLCPTSGRLIKANDVHNMVDVLFQMARSHANLNSSLQPNVDDKQTPREFVLKHNNIRNMVKSYENLALKALNTEAAV
ncbi:glycosyltransferase [Vibrio genomosp. F10]|uniref:Glycosyl transferase n=2 Tax=Vibrio genomosp. F10 TaxID=723171 RepID=A0A1B9QZD9_9VIBR|nr:glycosyltransferase [Vibrio genomosp. F10]OCH76590.1 glycosyl transferase [Vibrio genomosp. F10]